MNLAANLENQESSSVAQWWCTCLEGTRSWFHSRYHKNEKKIIKRRNLCTSKLSTKKEYDISAVTQYNK